jgi:hypothetical protein
MKRARTCAVVLAAVTLMFGIQAASAASTQWFPSAGTTVDYQLSWNLSFTNGTRYTNVMFNVYNSTVDSILYIYPKALDDNIYTLTGKPNYVTLATGVTVKVRNVYAETSSTTLERHLSVTAGNVTFENHRMRLLLFRNNSWSIILNLNTTNDGVSKSGFYTTPFRFLDYIDCTKNPGDIFPDTIQPAFSTIVTPLQATIVGRSLDFLDSVAVYDVGTQIYRGSYITNLAGQVLSYTYTFKGITTLANIAGASCAFSRPVATTLLPEYAYWAICGVLGVLVIVMGVVAAKRGRK